MVSELLSILKKIIEDVNSDYVTKKILPSESLVIELRATDNGSIYVEVSENGLRILDKFDGQPESTIMSSSENLMKILKGELDPVKAFFFGKVKVEGSIDIAYIIYERLRDYQRVKKL
ncbi:MAG: SCP2 sterol-binding domain-containing protein [Thaumarchaeota archaeon]|nr:SCP2 sterol-binding domain-containing protein [Candidatus Geocrenenecus arthurdayi]MCL7404205.1 SCP2 sterol-binding domain-containing protein [Candidatus Geocrenenecus arthurdayi]